MQAEENLPPAVEPAATDRSNVRDGVRLSEQLRRLAQTERSRMALGEITRALRDRGFGALLVLLALPNLVPMPPGASTVFGLPMILIAGQLLLGYRRPLLTRTMRNRNISAETFRGIIRRAEPWLAWYETLTRPRLWPLPHAVAEKILAFGIVLMGAVLVLPIPFGNFFPGIAVVFMSMGLIARDGLWALAGLFVGLAAIAIAAGIVSTAGLAALSIF
jgi:hypothetical protein